MAKRTNRAAWRLAVVLAVVVAWGGTVLASYSQRGLPEQRRTGVFLLPRSQWGFAHYKVYWVNSATEPVTERYTLGFFAAQFTHHGLNAPLVVHHRLLPKR